MTALRETGFPPTVGRARLAALLQEKYPDHRWDTFNLLQGRFAQQKRLERTIRDLFPVE